MYKGKVAIVTGAASGTSPTPPAVATAALTPCYAGIGHGIAEHLLDQGARVVVGDLNAVAGVQVVGKLKQRCVALSR